MISVIIPVYNAQDTLDSCLSALFKQSLPFFEAIVVDDSSTDNSLEITKTYPCKVVRMQENKGPGGARNEGARVAKGDILVFTDSDCVVPPDWLERIDRFFKDNNLSALTGGYSKALNNNYIGRHRLYESSFYNPDKPGFVHMFNTYNFACRKEAFFKAGGFSETHTAEDMLLNYFLYKNDAKIYYDNRIDVAHYFHNTLTRYLKQQFSWIKGLVSFFSRCRYPESILLRWHHKMQGGLMLQLIIQLVTLLSAFLYPFYPLALIAFLSGITLLFILNYPLLRFVMHREGKSRLISAFLLILIRNTVWLCAIGYAIPANIIGIVRNIPTLLEFLVLETKPLLLPEE